MSFIIPNIAVITYRDDVSAAVVDDVSVLRGDSGLSWRDVTAASGGVMLVASSATVTCARHDQYMSRHRVKSWYMYSRRQHASHRHVYMCTRTTKYTYTYVTWQGTIEIDRRRSTHSHLLMNIKLIST